MKVPRRTGLFLSDALMNISAAKLPAMGLRTFCLDETAMLRNNSNNSYANPQIKSLKSTFRIIMIFISVIGVAGNVLNLLTLRSPSLRTVPFRYIRALAVYDLVSLTAILVHFLLEILRFDGAPIIYYKVWIEDVLINSFLVAGLYVAVLLTIERYLLIRKPHKKSRLLSIENTATLKIVLALIASVLLHLPMALQNTVKQDSSTGRLVKGNNQRFLCREPYWTIFTYYKMFREFLRFFCVVILMSLNITIAKSLQIAKKNRRMLIKRSSQPDCAFPTNDIVLCTSGSTHSNTSQPSNAVKERTTKRDLNLLKSFTEKKLTVLMGSICLIYVIGNVPQMVVMVVQNESLNDMFGFQVFRNVANTLEVLNHCLNFFIFCMASSEYTRAFLLNNCAILRHFLLGFPCIADFINARRANSLFDQYDLQSTISDGGEKPYYKTDCIANAAAQKRSVATMSPSSNHLQVDLVRRKSASMCLPTPPTLEALGIINPIEDTPLPPAASLILNKEIENFHLNKSLSRQRGSVCLSLLRGDKVSMVGGQSYRDNKLPQRRESVHPNSQYKSMVGLSSISMPQESEQQKVKLQQEQDAEQKLSKMMNGIEDSGNNNNISEHVNNNVDNNIIITQSIETKNKKNNEVKLNQIELMSNGTGIMENENNCKNFISLIYEDDEFL